MEVCLSSGQIHLGLTNLCLTDYTVLPLSSHHLLQSNQATQRPSYQFYNMDSQELPPDLNIEDEDGWTPYKPQGMTQVQLSHQLLPPYLQLKPFKQIQLRLRALSQRREVLRGLWEKIGLCRLA
jgi:hypothetical protein